MKTINKVLVAIDLSLYSELTLRYAVLMAEKFDAHLTIVNVINTKDLEIIRKVAAYELARSMEVYAEKAEREYIERVRGERTLAIDALMTRISHTRVSVSKIFKIGVPFKELLTAIEEEQADLMVIGAKGRSNVMDVLFGSTAENIQRFCKIPLLSVRGEELS